VDGSRSRRRSAKVVLSRRTSLEPPRWRSRPSPAIYAIGSTGGVVVPGLSKGVEARKAEWDLVHGNHQGQGS